MALPPALKLLGVMKRLPQALLLLLGMLLWPEPASPFLFFSPKPFKGNSLINAGALGLDKLRGRVIAFGDFDGDQLCVFNISCSSITLGGSWRISRSLDVVSLSDDQHTVGIHIWDHGQLVVIRASLRGPYRFVYHRRGISVRAFWTINNQGQSPERHSGRLQPRREA